jgi:hypothetical protein
MKPILRVLFIGLFLHSPICYGAEDFFARREPIDLAKAAGSSRLLLVGDDHTQPAIKHFLADELPILRRAGFSHLAIEMLPTDFQDDLDAWTPESQERIRRHLVTAWSEKGPGVAESLFALIEEAKRQGMGVLALDVPDAWDWDRVAVNPVWADCIKACLSKNPSMRMIVFAGRSHVDPTPASLSSLLNADGLTLSVVQFAGLDSEETVQIDLKTARLLGRATHPATLLTHQGYQTGLRQNCMVPCHIKSCCQSASNWIVNLAETPAFLALR